MKKSESAMFDFKHAIECNPQAPLPLDFSRPMLYACAWISVATSFHGRSLQKPLLGYEKE